jgi:hypothetical protein
LEITNPQEIQTILERCKVLHLGLVDEGMPYVVPMNFGYTMENGKLTLYLHSASQGYKLDVIRKNPVCCFEMECDVAPFEGALPCQYGMVYQSLMGKGTIEIIDDVEKKMDYLSIFMKSQTGKDFVFNERLVSIVSVFTITVSEYTAKRRPHPAEREGEC